MRQRSLLAGLVLGLCLGALGGVILSTAVVARADSSESERVRVVHDTRAVHKIDPEGLVRAVLLARGQNAFVGKLVMQPQAQVPPRRSSTEEYLYIIEGSSVMTVNSQSYIIGPNMAVYIPAGGEVSFIVGSEPLVAVQVFAGPEPAAIYNEWKSYDASVPERPRRRSKRVPQRQSLLMEP